MENIRSARLEAPSADSSSELTYSIGKSHFTLYYRQFRALLWKNWLLRRRSSFLLFAELFFPLVFVFILAGFRSQVPIVSHPACHIRSQSMPSMGLLYYLQSMVCNLNYTCYASDPDEDPGIWRSRTPFHYFIRNLTALISNEKFRLLVHSLNNTASFDQFSSILELSGEFLALYNSYSLLPSLRDAHPASGDALSMALDPSILKTLSLLVCGTQQNDIAGAITMTESFFNSSSTLLADLLKQGVIPDLRRNGTMYNVCPLLKYLLTQNPILRTTGRLRQFLFGQLAYFPKTNFTDQVVYDAHETFRFLSAVRVAIKRYFELDRPNLLSFLSRVLNNLRISMPLCRVSFLIPTEMVEVCKTVAAYADDTVDADTTGGSSLRLSQLVARLDTVLSLVGSLLDCMRLDNRYLAFTSLDEFDLFLTQFAADVKLAPVGLSFDTGSENTSAHYYSITIRADPFTVDSTYRYKVLDNYWFPSPRRKPETEMNYFTSGFLDIQETISRAIVAASSTSSHSVIDTLGTELKMFPTPAYSDSAFLDLFGPHLPQLIILAWSLTTVACVKYLVDERECGLLQMFRVLRIPSGLSHLSWFVISLCIVMATTVPMIVVLKNTGIVPNADVFLLLFFSLSYTLAILSYSFLCSLFFTRANLAAIVSGGFYFMGCMPGPILLHYENFISPSILLMSGLLPQVSYSFGWTYVFRLEMQGSGARWTNMWHSTDSSGPYSLGVSFIFLWTTILLQLCSALWLVPWMKFMLPLAVASFRSLIHGESQLSNKPQSGLMNGCAKSIRGEEAMATLYSSGGRRSSHCELGDGASLALESFADHLLITPSVQVVRISKAYNNYARSVVLEDVNLRFFSNQVSALLGHNGAGKTTLLSILAGIVRPSTGTVIVHGRPLHTYSQTLQHYLGYCPQQDVLYPSLTVKEHLQFYAFLKGFSQSQTKRLLGQCLTDFGFGDKCDCTVSSLSGGQRRKLSVCLAFLGSPRSAVILLDEPTASLDPLSKRIIWDEILSMKTGRTVIFTSHHMREVDFLCDQMAFLCHGQVCCFGSSVSLKSAHGKGYLLTLERQRLTVRNGARHDYSSVLAVVRSFVPQATLVGQTLDHLFVRLPIAGALNGQYVQLFEHLQTLLLKSKETTIPISHFSITDTSLDDVFMQISESAGNVVSEDSVESSDVIDLKFVDIPKSSPISESLCSTGSQTEDTVVKSKNLSHPPIIHSTMFTASSKPPLVHFKHESFFLAVKYLNRQLTVIACVRFLYIRRNKRVWFFEFFLPCVIILLALILFSLKHPNIDQPMMDLNPWLMTARREKNQLTFVAHDVCTSPRSSSPSSTSGTPLSVALSQAFNIPYAWTGSRCLPRHLYLPKPNFIGNCSTPDESTHQWDSNPLMPNGSCFPVDYTKALEPPKRPLPTGDWLLNLTHFNISDFLLKQQISGEFYGGLSYRSINKNEPNLLSDVIHAVMHFLNNFTTYSDLFLTHEPANLGKQADVSRVHLSQDEHVRIWYNNKGFPSAPSFLNMFHNLLLMFKANDHTDDRPWSYSKPVVGLVVTSHPLPFATFAWFSSFREALMFQMAFVPFLILALTIIPANFVIPLVSERHSGLKHLLRMSGLQTYFYWFVNFVCDFFIFMLLTLLYFVLLAVFQKSAFISPSVVVPFMLVVLLFGLSMIPLVYLIAFLFQHPSTAFVLISAVNIFLASLTFSVDVLLRILLFQDSRDEVRTTVNAVHYTLLYLLPHHCLSSAVLDLTIRGFLRTHNLPSSNRLYRDSSPTPRDDSWNLLYPPIVCLLIQAIVFWTCLLLVENRSYGWRLWDTLALWCIRKNSSLLQMETEPLHSAGPTASSAITIRRLCKNYRGQSRPALDNLSLTIQSSECFGLLGTNGAGKSTTFSILTGRIPIRRKNTVFLNGVDLAGLHPHPHIGYCPQGHALHSFLTANETLQIYGRLRGLSGVELNSTVNNLLVSVGLESYRDRQVHTYSGGTKRKLSTAIAFIGDPEILLLDEPSSGMDPGARHLLWNQIRSAIDRQRTILLSSHCMEECETLCNRVGLLVDGRLKCVGRPLELKQRFNVGYLVDFELTPDALTIDLVILESRLQQLLPNFSLRVPPCMRQQYSFDGTKPVSELFRGFQEAYHLGLISHFSVKYSTLEDAFVRCISSPPQSESSVW